MSWTYYIIQPAGAVNSRELDSILGLILSSPFNPSLSSHMYQTHGIMTVDLILSFYDPPYQLFMIENWHVIDELYPMGNV